MSRIVDHRPSSAERAILRLKLALEYGDHAYPAILKGKKRVGAGAERGYQKTTKPVPGETACHMCDAPLQITHHEDETTYLQLDRIDAGGRYVPGNLLPACKPCNIERSDAPLADGHADAYRAHYGRGGKYLGRGGQNLPME